MNDLMKLIRPAKTALVLLAASVIASCLLIASLHHDLAKKQQRILQTRRALSVLRDEADQLKRDLETTDRLAGRYRQLQQQGFIGAADRSGWVQRLEDIYRDTRLPAPLRYALSAPQPINARPVSESTAYRNNVLQHELTLELSGINDEEFLDFMAKLSANWQAPYLVQGCQISREPEVMSGLQIKCTLQLYSLPERSKG